MILEKLPDVNELSHEEKRQLIDELWTELLPDAGSIPSPETLSILESRLAAYRRDPLAAAPWAAVKERLRAARGL